MSPGSRAIDMLLEEAAKKDESPDEPSEVGYRTNAREGGEGGEAPKEEEEKVIVSGGLIYRKKVHVCQPPGDFKCFWYRIRVGDWWACPCGRMHVRKGNSNATISWWAEVER